MKCFYHSADLDGHCSGAIIKLKYPDCEMFPIDYGDPFPWSAIKFKENEAKYVFMVDFCLQPFSDMLKLKDMCSLIWIDHHKTAINEWKKVKPFIRGIRDTKFAACELVWEYIYDADDPKETPKSVKLLGRYDIWNNTSPIWESTILPFQYGLKMYKTDPKEVKNLELWYDLLTDNDCKINDIINEGNIILAYQKKIDREVMLRNAFERDFEGYKALCVVSTSRGSKLFDNALNKDSYDLFIVYEMRKDRLWNIHMYSEKIDVGEIAKKYGGGGHKGAAGFQIQDARL